MLAVIRIEILARLGTAVLRILNSTLRWKLVGASPFLDSQKRIFVYWHGQQLLMPFSYFKFSRKVNRLATLNSAHSDGKIVARLQSLIGLQSIAGSSSRGGVSALRQLIAFVKAGDHVSVTPDGPRGPRCVLKRGVLKIAQKTGAPIRCLALGFSNQWSFGSWDKMILPKPFSKAILASSADIFVPSSLDERQLEEYRLKVEDTLNQLSNDLCRYANA